MPAAEEKGGDWTKDMRDPLNNQVSRGLVFYQEQNCCDMKVV
jgi:hypothetical protein